jgi:predicted ATPase
MNGDTERGLAEIDAALESYYRTGTGLLIPQWCLMLAEAQLQAGCAEKALAWVRKGISHAEEYQEHVNEPELHRLQGEIYLSQGDPSAGESSLRRAVDLARGQQAKMLELRSANALAALQRDQGRIAEARDLLEPLYDWFQEGFDSPELRESRAVLDSLGSPIHNAWTE